jgi:hypothetical protein
MRFKKWILIHELVDTGEPVLERPDLLATAIPKVNKDEEPIKFNKPSPTAKYMLKKNQSSSSSSSSSKS